MELRALQFGSRAQGILAAALPAIKAAGGLNGAGPGISAAAAARASVSTLWKADAGVLPAILWTRR